MLGKDGTKKKKKTFKVQQLDSEIVTCLDGEIDVRQIYYGGAWLIIGYLIATRHKKKSLL
jgi:hypothetical protein